jgi:hypothetical protein
MPILLKNAFSKKLRKKIKMTTRKLNRKRFGYEPLDPLTHHELSMQFVDDINFLIEEIDRNFILWHRK